MKITHNKVGQNLNLRDSGKTEKSGGPGAAAALKDSTPGLEKADALKNLGSTEASRVDISKRAQDIRKAKEIALATPDVDEAKVARLQKMIEEGKYKVDAAELADKMIDEQLKWE